MSQDKNICRMLWLEMHSRWSALRERDAERGASLAEYGLLLILVGIAAFAVIALLGGEIWELFRDVGEATEAREVPPPPD